MNIDWKTIAPAVFEKLCAAVLANVGYKNIQWYGEAGSDKGRDILAERIDSPVPGVERREKWMIQCKRYTQSTLSKKEVKDLMDAALEHEIDGLLIIVTSKVSANLRDWLSAAQEKYPFRAFIWEEIDFRRQVRAHAAELLDLIPELTSDRDPLWLYEVTQQDISLGCNNFDDVEILVRNVKTLDEAKAKASEFLKHLQKNGYEWWDTE